MGDYPRMENISKFDCNDYQNVTWVVQHKLDGANIGLEFDSTGTKIWTRNQALGYNVDFEGIRLELLNEQHVKLACAAIQYQLDNNCTLRFFGELHGKLQRRIDYGPTNVLRYFDMTRNGIWLSWYQMQNLFVYFDSMELMVWTSPPVELYVAIETGLELCAKYCAKPGLRNGGELMIEGIVFKPHPHGKPLKMKSPQYEAIEGTKIKKVVVNQNLVDIVCNLITTHRVEDEHVKKIFVHDGELVKAVAIDACNEAGIAFKHLSKQERALVFETCKEVVSEWRRL